VRERVLEVIAQRWFVTGFLGACLLGAMGHMSFGCSGWDPTRPFERNNPDVDRALEMLEASEYENAEEVLRKYLKATECKRTEKLVKGQNVVEGELELPRKLKGKENGAFDLGLALFHLGEKYGERFGDEDKIVDQMKTPPESADEVKKLIETYENRNVDVTCALIVALAIAKDPSLATELRARAYYLAGNLEFLRIDYPKAIIAYNEALRLIPGIVEEAGGDGIGRDAAWNRAVALRRLQKQLEEEDAGADAGEDGEAPEEPDGGDGDQDPDGGNPNDPDGDQDGGGEDAGDGGGDDAGEDGGDTSGDAGPDGGQDAGDADPLGPAPDAGDEDPQPAEPADPRDPQPAEPQPAEPDGQGPSGGDQGDRILDRFDQVPTYQQEEAKKRAEGRRRTMEDK